MIIIMTATVRYMQCTRIHVFFFLPHCCTYCCSVDAVALRSANFKVSAEKQKPIIPPVESTAVFYLVSMVAAKGVLCLSPPPRPAKRCKRFCCSCSVGVSAACSGRCCRLCKGCITLPHRYFFYRDLGFTAATSPSCRGARYRGTPETPPHNHPTTPDERILRHVLLKHIINSARSVCRRACALLVGCPGSCCS